MIDLTTPLADAAARLVHAQHHLEQFVGVVSEDWDDIRGDVETYAAAMDQYLRQVRPGRMIELIGRVTLGGTDAIAPSGSPTMTTLTLLTSDEAVTGHHRWETVAMMFPGAADVPAIGRALDAAADRWTAAMARERSDTFRPDPTAATDVWAGERIRGATPGAVGLVSGEPLGVATEQGTDPHMPRVLGTARTMRPQVVAYRPLAWVDADGKPTDDERRAVDVVELRNVEPCPHDVVGIDAVRQAPKVRVSSPWRPTRVWHERIAGAQPTYARGTVTRAAIREPIRDGGWTVETIARASEEPTTYRTCSLTLGRWTPHKRSAVTANRARTAARTAKRDASAAIAADYLARLMGAADEVEQVAAKGGQDRWSRPVTIGATVLTVTVDHGRTTWQTESGAQIRADRLPGIARRAARMAAVPV